MCANYCPGKIYVQHLSTSLSHMRRLLTPLLFPNLCFDIPRLPPTAPPKKNAVHPIIQRQVGLLRGASPALVVQRVSRLRL